MNRKTKWRFWNGIRFRSTAGLLLLLIFSCILLYLAVMEMLNRNMESQVISDLSRLAGNTEVYVRQILMLNNQNNDEEGYQNCVSAIAEELYSVSQNSLILFTLDGEPIMDYGYSDSIDRTALYDSITESTAFSNAQSGNASYFLSIASEGTYQVWFTMPLEIADRKIGIINYYLDYTATYQQYNRMVTMILNITMVTLLFIVLLMLLFLTGILRPIQRLGRISSRVSAEIRNGQVSTGNLIGKSLTNRKDELGQLSRDYQMMLRTVEDQFARIQEDRDNILKLLNSRQEFYNNVTHELKTPLTTIQGYAQLLSDDNMSDQELFYTALSHIQHESSRLHRMVIQLLEMSNREIHTRMEPIDAAAVLSSVAVSMSLKAKRYNNTIQVEGPASLRILGNEERIRQLFINLIDNAIKYGESGQPIRAVISESGDLVTLQIINRGEGIAPDSLPHIFEAFYREDKEHSREMGSAGLGLSICKKIVDEHHGSITARSVPGQDTAFTVTLPKYSDP